MTTNTEDWEKEFRGIWEYSFDYSGSEVEKTYKELVSFITSLITKTEADTLERVKKLVLRNHCLTIGIPL
jgi:hypothetical protein